MLNVQSAMNMDSLIEVSGLFQTMKERGFTYVGLTDNGTMHNLFEVSEEIKKTGLQAVVGCKFPFRIGQNVVTLALYPRNNRGKRLLFAESSKFHKNQKRNLGLEGKKSVLKEMAIVIDTLEIDSKAVKETIRTLKTMLENTNTLFVGLHETFSKQFETKNMLIKKVLVDEGVKYLPFNEVKYLDEKDFDSYNYMMEMRKNEQVNDMDNILLSIDEIEQLFDYMSDLVDGTRELVLMCKADYTFKQEKIKMPSFPVPENFTPGESFKEKFAEYIKSSSAAEVQSAGYLFNLVLKGLMIRYGRNEKAIDRALKELKVIIEKNLSDYFLIVWDFYKYAKENGILTGPGRGSVAGSIVAYCLGITAACPLEYNLQFERFLNIYRKGMPDIDTDFPQKSRNKILSYLRQKYGQQFVAHIITRSNYGYKKIQTNMLKQMRVPAEVIEKIKEFKPENFEDIEQLVAEKPEVKELMGKYKDVRVLLEQGYRLKKVPETTSTHAAGILISNVPLEDEMPMMIDSHGNLITQVENDNEKNSMEQMGLLKFDILGLKNLDILDHAKKLVEKKTGQPFPEFDYEDARTLQLLNEAKYLGGIFQLESYSAKKALEQIGVKSFFDIVITNAFNRPGPAEFIPLYATRKGQPVKMFDEKGNELRNVEELYPILEESAGIIIFQEQINDIVCAWANYDLADADMYRRAISKKDREALLVEGEKFIKRAVELGRDESTTKELFKIILRFAEFGFNKSHAVVYSMISFMLAYLKANHPVEFFAALMTHNATDKEKLSRYIKEAREMGIEILPPDINTSTDEFIVEGEAIRCAFQMVDSVGEKTAQAIVEVRNTVPFNHIYDVVKRIKTNPSVDNGNVEVLAKVGAMDSLGERHEILAHLKGVKDKDNTKAFSLSEKLLMEIEGCNVSFSLPKLEREKLEKAASIKSSVQAGVIRSIRETRDKYKREMAWVNMVTLDGYSYNPVIFNKLWKECKNDIVNGSLVLVDMEKGIINKITTLEL